MSEIQLGELAIADLRSAWPLETRENILQEIGLADGS